MVLARVRVAATLFVFAGTLCTSISKGFAAGGTMGHRATDDSWYTSVAQNSGWSAGAGCYLDQYGYCLRNCTSYVAQRLAAVGVRIDHIRGLGNGGLWYGRASAKGLPVSGEAKPGAAAVIPNNPGHVAFVERVNSDGSLNVKSYNGYTEQPQHEFDTRRYAHFIHFSHGGLVSDSAWRGVGDASFRGNRLRKGQSLHRGQYLTSRNLMYVLLMQHDGNLVLYSKGKARWHARTSGKGGIRVVLQRDGNLVMYRSNGSPVWHTQTHRSGAGRAAVQSDGNFVMYAQNSAKWQSGTSGGRTYAYRGSDRLRSGQQMSRGSYLRSADGRYAVLLQPDGNLVLYSAGYHVLWHSRTNGAGSDRVVMQKDGNLVLYAGGSAVWHTHTQGAGDRIVLQNDGNVVLYAINQARWHTRTSGKI